jgi:hypothetical protein
MTKMTTSSDFIRMVDGVSMTPSIGCVGGEESLSEARRLKAKPSIALPRRWMVDDVM